MSRKKEIFDQAVESLREFVVPPGPSDELIHRTLKRIEQAQDTNLSRDMGRRRFSMKSIKKLSIAAVFIFGVSALLILNWLPGGVALADVYARVQQSKSYMYNISSKMTGMPGTGSQTVNMDGTILISDYHGMRINQRISMPEQNQTNHQQLYLLPDKGVIIVMPEDKTYMRMELSDDLMSKTKKQNNDPREMVRQMMESDHVSLGSAVIDGVLVEGFETTDPLHYSDYNVLGGDVRVTLWVDSSSGLPVYAEIVASGDGMEMDFILSDFQWDVYVEAEDFIPLLAADYEDFGSIKMPEMNEETAIEGLEFFAELSGSYPKRLEIIQLTNELMGLQDSETEAAVRFREKLEETQTDQQRVLLIKKFTQPIDSLGLFYIMLVQEQRDPAYYGEQVTPGDADVVLLRWKTDSGTYRAIFGDLSVMEMDYEDLIWLEPEIEAIH